MRWSENETCQFVKLYLSHDYLYDTAHDHYKLKDKRLQAYRNIMAEFKASTGISLTIGELKVKIKNLRSTYSQELLKIRQRSTPEYTYKPTIRWFAYWHARFKSPSRSAPTSRTRSLDEDHDDECSDYTLEDTSKIWLNREVDNLSEETTVPQEDLLPVHSDYVLLPKSEPEDSPIKNHSNSYKSKRRKINGRTSSTTSDGTFQGSMDSSLDSNKSDEFDIYGKYIASQLRTMNLKKALRLQLEIQSLVSEARISDL